MAAIPITPTSMPAIDAVPIVADVAFDQCKGIYVGVAGDITMVTAAGGTRLFKNAAAGSTIPVCATRVNASGTTATNLLAYY